MSPKEFENAVKGWEEERRDRLEFDRQMGFYIVKSIQNQIKKNTLKPTDLFNFPWDAQQTLQSGKAMILKGDEKQQHLERLKKVQQRLKK